MCDSTSRKDFIRGLRRHLADAEIHCEDIENTTRNGFWIEDSRWKRPSGDRVGIATACSNDRPAAFREPHRLLLCFHLAPSFSLRLDLQNEALIAMPQWYEKPWNGYVHLWFANPADGSELDFSGQRFEPAFGQRVRRLLELIRPAV